MTASIRSFNTATRRPVALGLAIAVGSTAGLMAGQALAADVPQTYTPAPAPVVQERLETSFGRFGPYVGVRGGAGMVDDTSFTADLGPPATVNTEYDDWNLTGSAFAGYEMEVFPGLSTRLEAEVGYSTFEVESHSVGGIAQPSPTGDASAFTGMVNAYVDTRLGNFRPFVGGGLGIASVSLNDQGAGGTVLMDDDDTKFAWQVAGGVGYDISQRLTLEGMVRYQSVMDVGLTSTTVAGSLSSSTDLNSTSGLLGLRYAF